MIFIQNHIEKKIIINSIKNLPLFLSIKDDDILLTEISYDRFYPSELIIDLWYVYKTDGKYAWWNTIIDTHKINDYKLIIHTLLMKIRQEQWHHTVSWWPLGPQCTQSAREAPRAFWKKIIIMWSNWNDILSQHSAIAGIPLFWFNLQACIIWPEKTIRSNYDSATTFVVYMLARVMSPDMDIHGILYSHAWWYIH